MSMNPRITTDKIRSDYQDYIASILSVKDREITKLAHKAVKGTEFVKGPYLETTLPFVESHSLKDLAEEGLISKEFEKMGKSVHYDEWKLRIHQENALRHIITEQRNMVVSTGTGSGKTECYLYPIFNELMREKEEGKLDAGVRALLIFPMNALANDQQKKLRKLLKSYPDITFGRYTGETAHKSQKETPEQAEERLHAEYNNSHASDSDADLRYSIPNELMCREMMAKKPPHILLTNYAMLEYMLLRPDTAPFFDNESAKNWRFLVIDEAHTYKGANGTEIAFLLRRVKERIRHFMKKPFICIATSATLGSNEAKGGLAEFAQNIFDEPFSAEDVITTTRAQRDQPEDGHYFMPEEYTAIKMKIAGMTEEEKGLFLYEKLSKDLRLFDVYEVLKSKPKKIEEVAGVVFSDIDVPSVREAALIDLIELSAAAKKSEYESALLPARYHLFVKSLEGMFVQYYPQKHVFLDRKEKVRDSNNYYSVFELANCQKCGQEYLVGMTSEQSGGNYLIQKSNSDKPEYYFVSDIDNDILDGFDEDDSIEETGKMGNLEKYHLCMCCGRITPFAQKHPVNCCENADKRKIVTVFNLKYSGKGNESNCCPCCGATQKGLIKRFLTANQPATFAVAKSLYDAIPPRPVASQKIEDDLFDDIFDDPFEDIESDSDEIAPSLADESGRKLLIFSDNRQEAAFFAGFFEKKYCLIMWRKVILQCLKDAGTTSLRMDDLIERARTAAEKSGLYTFDKVSKDEMSDDQKWKQAAHYVLQEFLNPDVVTGLEGLGYIQVYPEPLKLRDAFELAGLKGDNVWNIVRFLMDTLRQKGAISYPENIRASDEFFAPRNHAGYFREIGSSKENGGYTYGFVPQDKSLNKRLGLIIKLLNNPESDPKEVDIKAREELKTAYKLLMALKKQNYIIETQDSFKGVVYCLNYAKWNFKYVHDDETLYRCKKCGKVFSYSINGICPEMKCNGRLESVKAKEIKDVPYYNRLFEDSKLIPMVSREHTAQLSSKTAGEYQKDFEEGKINVLSCSTTFEMGVDVGELEATFQRNVPPETSNYIQRAGRAGRRTSSAAFSVTFARRSSHDMTFFQNPAQIIAGKISAPVLEIDNEKIAERHLNSVIVSWFFKKHPEFFTDNTKRIVAYGREDNMSVVLRESLEEHPQELLESIHSILPESICEGLDVDNWSFIEDIAGKEGSLTKAIEERLADVSGLREFTDELEKDSEGGIKKQYRIIAAKKLIETLDGEASINFLSSNGVLPKYGFPVDSVSLGIISGNEEEAKKIDLSRDLKIAISEFAPPAQIVANGKVWQSYAINTVPNKSWPTYIYYECPKCRKIYPPTGNVVDVTADLEEAPKNVCDMCGTLMNPKKFIIPLFGFSTLMGDKPKPVGESKPRSYYSTRTQFWGIDGLTEKQKAEARDGEVVFNGKKVDITYSPGGKLFVLNQGNNDSGIRVCPSCGFACDYSTIIKGGKHNTKFSKPCGSRNLVTVSLGHDFSTDILKIKLPVHDVDLKLPDGVSPKDQDISVLYAILEGASTALDISRDDISGCVTGKGELILYDEAAGGAGFVKHIFDNFEKVIRSARNKVAGQCGCTPETSCYGCLRNYSNQYYHDNISRGLAYEYLDWLINRLPVTEYDTEEATVTKPEVETEQVGLKKMIYDAPDVSIYPDVVSVFASMIESSDDESEIIALKKLIDIAKSGNYENPITEEKLPAAEGDLWPDIFWGSSKVALFTESMRKQYNILRKYDWYCYILDEKINAERVFSHIKEM